MRTLRFPLAFLLLLLTVSLACGQRQPTTLQPHTWQRHTDNPIIVPGFRVTPGGPIGQIVADPSVLYDEEDKKWKMWFATWWKTGLPAPQDTRIGIKHAESDDGVRWTVQEGWALEPGATRADWDYANTETPAVVKYPSTSPERRYILWYVGGNLLQREIQPGFPYYQIGMAFSRMEKGSRGCPQANLHIIKPGLYLWRETPFPVFLKPKMESLLTRT